MIKQNIKFYIIVTGHNCARYVGACLDGLARQTYQNFECHIISDGSTDRTEHVVMENLRLRFVAEPKKWNIHFHKDNRFAAFRRYQAIKDISERKGMTGEEVFITVDLDDRLHTDALEVIKAKYDTGAWMTYGTWINHKGHISPVPLHYSVEDIVTRNFRKLPYRPVSPNTFKLKLWRVIPESDYLGPDGKWLEICTETGFRLSCLELCGMDRVGIIEQPIYMYNAWLPQNTQRKYGQEFKNRIRDYVFSQPKKNLYEYYQDRTSDSVLHERKPEVVPGGIQGEILPDGVHRY